MLRQLSVSSVQLIMVNFCQAEVGLTSVYDTMQNLNDGAGQASFEQRKGLPQPLVHEFADLNVGLYDTR